MKIMIFTVNYNADEKLFNFIESVKQAQKQVDIEIIINVLDNSQKVDKDIEELKGKLKSLYDNISIFSDGTNSGYFGGIKQAQILLDNSYDSFIYCNPDILLDNFFFMELEKLFLIRKCIIAPSILSKEDGFDQNPKYMQRLPESKLIRLKYIYSNMITYCLFQFLARIKEIIDGFKSQKEISILDKELKIYAPHGSIFIFNDIDFFKSLPEFECFLFGEEIFIAEEAIKSNQNIIYQSTLKVYDERHASISLLSCNFVRSLYYKSIDYLLKRYY